VAVGSTPSTRRGGRAKQNIVKFLTQKADLRRGRIGILLRLQRPPRVFLLGHRIEDIALGAYLPDPDPLTVSKHLLIVFGRAGAVDSRTFQRIRPILRTRFVVCFSVLLCGCNSKSPSNSGEIAVRCISACKRASQHCLNSMLWFLRGRWIWIG
jgi:hypothetical protein